MTWAPPGFRGRIGVARRDITPPPGIYSRCWGPSRHPTSLGVHRPLTATALAIRPEAGEPLLLLALDLGWWQRARDEAHVRRAVLERLALAPARVLVSLSHTHSGPSICGDDVDQPGGELVLPYLDAVADAAVDAADEALAGSVGATLEWAVGRSAVAANRDLPADGRRLVGFNPAAVADDTVLVGRVSSDDGVPLAVVVNYACHPTTLAWQNRLISPDFVGALRATVEERHGGLCVFLQGASGELGPREQYVGEVAVADRPGEAIGHAVLAALTTLPPPGTELACLEVVESGAPLALWGPRARRAPEQVAASVVEVPVELKPVPSLAELERDWEGIGEESRRERLRRARRLRDDYEDPSRATHPVWVWRLGETIVVAHPGEAYSLLQRELRDAFPGSAVVVANVTNGPGFVYLPPSEFYEEDIYPVWQTLLAPGSLERVVAAARDEVARLLAHPAAAAGAPEGARR